MEHLQVVLERNMKTNGDNNVDAPQEVVDAIITLTKAGLLDWDDTELGPMTKVGFFVHDGLLDHAFDGDVLDGAGFAMHITPEQEKTIREGIDSEKANAAKAVGE